MKQHILSQTYQAGFVDPNTPVGHEPYVWFYERDGDRWKKRAPHNLSWETDLYTVRDNTGKKDDSIERMFSVYEGKFASAMRVDLRKEPLTNQQRADVAYFVALLMIRVPLFFRDFVPALFSSEEALRVLIEKIPRFRDALAKSSLAADTSTIASTFQAMAPDEKKALILSYALASVDETAKKLYGMRWTYLFTIPKLPFVTSETPVTFTHRLGGKIPLGHSQLDDTEVEITFPLTSTITLGLLHSREGQAAGMLDSSGVGDLNTRVLATSRDYVICSSMSFPGDAALKAWKEQPKRSPLERLLDLTQ